MSNTINLDFDYSYYLSKSLSKKNTLSNSVPEPILQTIILDALFRFPGITQCTIPIYNFDEQTLDLSKQKALLTTAGMDSDCNRDYLCNCVISNFDSAPQAVRLSWYPYGILEVQKFKKVSQQKVQKRLFGPDIVKQVGTCGWLLSWDRNFAERIISGVNQFTERVQRTQLYEEVQDAAKSYSEYHDYFTVLVNDRYIEFSTGSGRGKYIHFKNQGLVNLVDAVQILGCRNAILKCFGNTHEWQKSLYYRFVSGYTGINGHLAGNRKQNLRQW